MRRLILRWTLAFVVLLLGAGGPASAAWVRFDFSYGSFPRVAPYGEGFGLVDAALLRNPSPGTQVLPWHSLTFIIGGTTADDGLFDETDFPGLLWNTGDATLDFTRELIGQATPHGPWQFATPGGQGNFALSGPLSTAVDFALILTGTEPDPILPVTSVRARFIPEPALPALLLAAVLAATATRRRKA